jgi:iron(III) transport system ATP-binding protein
MVSLKIKDLSKIFGEVVAVDRVNIEIEEGELCTLLGPSGCGKTTTLRCVAGFYTPDEGEIFFGEEIVNDVPPFKRNTGMVFQNYALWPHMKVLDNIAYGLKVRGVPRQKQRERVLEILDLVRLEGLEDRWPSQLSGGQQQRVALARALVIEPTVLLLDEPLSNLDAKLRVEMRTEIKKIQNRLKITSVYVTHDQEEALSISDKIAVMNKGKLQQIGTPRSIYEDPENRFVADFIGIANFIKGEVSDLNSEKEILEIRTDHDFDLTARLDDFSLKKGMTVLASIRPEAIMVYDRDSQQGAEELNRVNGEVRLTTYLGDVARYEIETSWGETMRADVYNPRHRHIFSEGEKVSLCFNVQDVKIIKL